MKIIIFDTETTGLDPRVHAIHQLSGEIVIDNQVVETFDYRIKPFTGYNIDPKALKISKTTIADLSTYTEESEIHFQLYEMFERHLNYKNKKDKFFLAGWRAPEFDVKFLQAFYERNNKTSMFNSYFWSNPIDIKALATQHLLDKRTEIPTFNLTEVAKYLRLEVNEEKLHTASYDAYLSRKIYEIITEL